MDENDKDLTIGIEDVLPVKSRISWGAILAGSVIALATILVLGLLGSAIGLTVNDDVESDTLSTGAALWGMISTVTAMFLAGWIASLCAVGETKREAVVHGIVTWGVVLAMGLWLVAMGVGAGFDAMTGMAPVVATADDSDWIAAARRAGVSQENIDQWQQSSQSAPADASQATQNAADTRRRVEQAATNATWWTLAGTVLSLAAAIVGSWVGAGPNFTIQRNASGGTYVVREGRYRTAV